MINLLRKILCFTSPILFLMLISCSGKEGAVLMSNTATPTEFLVITTTPHSPMIVGDQLAAQTDMPALVSTSTPTAVEEETIDSPESPTPDTRPLPREWAGWPIIPVVSEKAKEIYGLGIENGNDPHTFSVIGDCQSEPDVFMGIYETERNPLSDQDTHLLETINRFAGSFSQKRLGVRDGMSAPTALSPLWADKEMCEANESPLSCELRVRKPSIVFVNLGTNWKPGASAERYGEYLREIVSEIIASGAVPILSTKADNVEGDHSINRVTAEVAYEYEIPLWNFWLAADSLPNHGLDSERDNIYLTPLGWDRRNYTALQALDAVWRAIESE